MLNTVKTADRAEIYENGITLYLDRYIQERGIQYMSKETQNKWNACLLYIKKHVFNNQRGLMSTVNKSMYDEYKVNQMCDLISVGLNPMKILPALNRRHNWNMGQPRGIDGTIQHWTPEQIAADYPVQIEKKEN